MRPCCNLAVLDELEEQSLLLTGLRARADRRCGPLLKKPFFQLGLDGWHVDLLRRNDEVGVRRKHACSGLRVERAACGGGRFRVRRLACRDIDRCLLLRRHRRRFLNVGRPCILHDRVFEQGSCLVAERLHVRAQVEPLRQRCGSRRSTLLSLAMPVFSTAVQGARRKMCAQGQNLARCRAARPVPVSFKDALHQLKTCVCKRVMHPRFESKMPKAFLCFEFPAKRNEKPRPHGRSTALSLSALTNPDHSPAHD